MFNKPFTPSILASHQLLKKMVNKALSRFLSFTSRLILRQLRTNTYKLLSRKSSSVSDSSSTKYHKFSSITDGKSEVLKNIAMSCDVEGGLVRSSNLFPYFMLVAFEAGSILRALVLLALYPFLCLIRNDKVRIKVMVMVCFIGIRKDGFRIGASVLPKFLSEDVGLEVFQVINNKRVVKKVGLSDLPRVMIESFLKDYMGFDCVIGRELKEFRGYFTGLMEDLNIQNLPSADVIMDGEGVDMMIGICNEKNSTPNQIMSICDEVYFTRDSDCRCWNQLPKDKYPKPLVFHDGRLAFRPTAFATLAMFMWLPFAICLAFIRSVIGFFLPYTISRPLLAFSGLRLRVKPNTQATLATKSKGILYVCNHRTLLDPLYLCSILNKNLTAVTYSLSRLSEILSPIKTVRLTRDSKLDSELMKKMLSQGNLVVCPEGTTCREPFLLRFSPLFTEMSEVIVPVALNSKVTMFYGTTASGLKCLDPFFFLMNPSPLYTVKFLDPVTGLSSSTPGVHDLGGISRDSRRFELANRVQSEIAKTLNFTCTTLTRKDKYMILAGNEGRVSPKKL